MPPQYSSRLRRLPAKTANHIRRYRIQLGLTQRELAERLGVRTTTMSSWERGQSCPSTPLLLRLAKLLDTMAEHLYPQFYLLRGPEGALPSAA